MTTEHERRKLRALERIADALEHLGIGEQPVDEPKATVSYSKPVTVQTPAKRPRMLDDDPAVQPMTGDD